MEAKLFRRYLSMLLTLLLVFSLLPTAAFAALITTGTEPDLESEPTTTVDINVIVVLDGYDGWQILYPESTGSTQVTVPYEGAEPTALDVVKAVDPNFNDELTNNRPTTFLGYSRGSNGYGNWSASKLSSGSYSNVTNFTTTTIADNDSIIIYLPFASSFSGAPTWDELEPLITNPIEPKTPEERLQDLIEAECSWDKIKGSNTDMDAVTANLSLPSNSSDYAIKFSWSVNENPYMSYSGKINLRPNLGEELASVPLTLSVKNGLMADTAKYGDYPDDTPIKSYELKILPLSQADIDANKPSVQAALAGIQLENLKLADGEALDPNNVLYDIQLVDPRDYGDKSTAYLPEFWSSDNPDVIKINFLRGKVTRPALGQPDAKIKLTITAAKGGYSESKEFTVTVKAVTQAELDAANAELDAVKDALMFDVIKKDNISADVVTSSLQMVYRGLDYPGTISWETKNSGEKGIKIEWETSDASTVKTYGTVTRPSAADKNVTLTATLTPFRLVAYVQPRTVEIPIIVRKVSESADVATISLSPSLGFAFDAGTKSYDDLTAPAIADSVVITVTTEETGTLITSGQHSARGTLSFDVALNTGQTAAVTINTKALDSENTDTYKITITRGTADVTDTAVLELLAAIAGSYKNTSNDWAAMDMAAYGLAGDVAGVDIVKNTRDTYANGSTTELARSVITLTALGVDASKVYSGSEGVYLDFIKKLGGNAPSQTMEAAFGLVALDSGEYDDNELTLTRQSCINFLLNKKLTPAAGQSAWAITGSSPDVDATAMAVAALAPYYDSNIDVKTAIDGALKYLSVQQQDSGHYGNSNSTSMVIVALTALGKDPGANTGDFIKNGISLIDGLLAFRTSSDRLGYDNNTTESAMSTEQGFRALVAYRGYLYSGNSAYDIYCFGPQTGDGTALTGESDPGVTPPDPSAPKNITVRIESLYNGTTLMPETSVKLSGTHLDALKAALTANGKNPATDLTESSGYVSAILGVSMGSTTGWMYAVNGEIPTTMLNETQIAEGDRLVLFFIDWYDSFYFTMFDKTSASIKEGESVTLKLTGLNPWDAMGSGDVYAPISGAMVYARDASGNRIGTDVITDADGKATLTFPTAGTYTISATRQGTINATDLVPPLCTVGVTSSSSSDPGKTITVYFTLRGLNSGSGNEETWISRKTVSNITEGATVADIIIKALEGTGYTQRGAQDGYISSVTTPGGFKLSEMHNGMPNSGWLYKVNSKLPTVGMDSHNVKDGDHVLLYFTKDYTKDPDAGSISGKVEEKPLVSSEVEVATVVKGGIAVASIDTGKIKDALDKLVKSSDTVSVAEVKVQVKGTAKTSTVEVEIKADAIKAITSAKNVQLTIESTIATLTFDAKSLAGITKGVADNSTIKFVGESVDTSKLDSENRKIVGDSPVFDLSVIIGDTMIHNFNGTVTVFLPFTPTAGTDPKTLTVYYLDDNKTPVPMENARYDAQRKGFVFTTTHFSLFFIAAVSVEWANPFADVKENDWFYDAVKYANINNMMTGTEADKFSPNAPMTRAMLITVLYRSEGEPAVTAANPFTDVAGGLWYTNAGIWAYENGIVAGYGDGLFGTNDNITREQLVTILSNYAHEKGLNVSQTTDLSAYKDTAEISSWALDAMKWARAQGLMQGRSTTTLAPKGTATRAEVATILMRYMENFMK